MCLHKELGGKVVSVTTDGFITDVIDLETELMNLPIEKRPLFTKYRGLRNDLSGNSTSLELKTKVKE